MLKAKTIISEIAGSESFIHLEHGSARWVMLSHGIHNIEPDTYVDAYLDTRHLMAFGPDGRSIGNTPQMAG